MSRMTDERFSEWMESLAEGTALIDIQGHEVLELLESMLEDRQRIEELERVLRVCGEAVLCPGNWHDLSPAALNGIAKHVPDFVSRAEAAEAKLARVEKVITDLDTQCTNSHAVKMLRKALDDTASPDTN